MLTTEQKRQFDSHGYLNVQGLFSDGEVQRYRQHFMKLRAAGSYPGDSAGIDNGSKDPLKRFPRMIHMHRWDQLSLQLDAGQPPARLYDRYAWTRYPTPCRPCSTSSPPAPAVRPCIRTRHYLRVQPGTCIAAWLALDDCDEENGCLRMVPDSHTLGLSSALPKPTRHGELHRRHRRPARRCGTPNRSS